MPADLGNSSDDERSMRDCSMCGATCDVDTAAPAGAVVVCEVCELDDGDGPVNSSDESPAVVELPDDAIEALVQAAEHAYEYTPYDEMAEHAWPNVVRAVYPLIAARVRAEALREAAEKIAPNQVRPSNVIVVGARMTDDVLDMVRTVEDALVAAVRAEAVAGERQRIADELREVERKAAIAGNWTLHDFVREVRLIREGWAAGSVPVATPPRVEVASIPLDELPDWTELAEAAGATLQNHEIGCSGEYETVMHWPDGRRAGNRDRLAIISEDAEMEQFANAAVGPVATRLQPGRVGFGTDAFEVGGPLPGQPVATPTEPAIPARLMSLEVPSDEEADERGVDGLLATFDVPAGNAWPAGEYSILAPASPVPAEQPSAAEQAMAARAEQALVQRVLDAHDDEFGTQHGVAYRVMVADHWRLIETFEPHRTGAAR